MLWYAEAALLDIQVKGGETRGGKRRYTIRGRRGKGEGEEGYSNDMQ